MQDCKYLPVVDHYNTGSVAGATILPSAKMMMHAELCNELNMLYRKKNQDYGDSFHKTFEEEGLAMARIRLSDKLERFKTLSKGATQRVQDEAMRDTLIDLANYALMTILEMDEMESQKVSNKEDFAK